MVYSSNSRRLRRAVAKRDYVRASWIEAAWRGRVARRYREESVYYRELILATQAAVDILPIDGSSK